MDRNSLPFLRAIGDEALAAVEIKRLARNRRRLLNRRARDEACKSAGLVKVRVNGKVFWE